MDIKQNLNKIKKEFKNAKRSFYMFSFFIIFILILFIAAAVALFIANANANPLLNYLPDGISAIEYFSETKNEKVRDLFNKEAARHFNLPDAMPASLDFKEGAIIFLPEGDNIRPIFLLTPKDDGAAIALWAKENNLTFEHLDEKTVILTHYPQMLKYFKKTSFPQKKIL